MKVTIKDVAAYTGLSITTVSRYLNNNYPVSKQAKSKIEQAIQVLGYKPNLVARSLKNRNTGIIGLVVADIANRFFMNVAKGLEKVISEEGYQIIFASSDGMVEKEHKILSLFEERRIDGLVIASSDTEAEIMNGLADRGMPIVAVDRWISGLHAQAVLEENENAAYRLVKRLIENGHVKIAFNNVNLSLTAGRERYLGARKAMKEHGLSICSTWVSDGKFSREESIEWIRSIFLDKQNRPTAVFCANNIMAEGTLIALKELGIKVPEDVSLVSFGEISMQRMIDPIIEAITQNPYEMGVAAGQLMLERLKNREQKEYAVKMIQLELRTGNSVRRL